MPKQTFFNLSERKRSRIIKLAVEEFAGRSFKLASLSRIVSRAGIAKGSIYQYFENKLDLYRWLVLEEGPRIKTAFLGLDAKKDGADFFGRAEEMMHAGLRFTVAHPRLARMMARLVEHGVESELRDLSGQLRKMSHQYMKQWIEEGQRAGTIRDDIDPDLAAHLAASFMGTGFVDALFDRAGVDLDQALENPSSLQQMGEQEQRDLVHGAVDLLRRGLGSEQETKR